MQHLHSLLAIFREDDASNGEGRLAELHVKIVATLVLEKRCDVQKSARD